MSTLGHYDSTVKIANLAQSLYNAKFVISGYIKIGGNIIYIQGKGNSIKPSEVSYSQLLNDAAPVSVSSKKEY